MILFFRKRMDSLKHGDKFKVISDSVLTKKYVYDEFVHGMHTFFEIGKEHLPECIAITENKTVKLIN